MQYRNILYSKYEVRERVVLFQNTGIWGDWALSDTIQRLYAMQYFSNRETRI